MRAFRSLKTPFPTGATPRLRPQLLTLLHRHLAVAGCIPMGKRNLSQSHPSAAPATANGKITFQSRKIRKVSAEGGASASASAAKDLPSKQVILPRPLTSDGELDAALVHLRSADPLLARVIDTHKPPAFQCVRTSFHALSRSILYQQLALKAAATIYNRFVVLCGGEAGIVPEVVLGLTPQQLRQIGVSGRKASYLHDLANKFNEGILSDASIVAMDDNTLLSMLTMVKGIGVWTVHMFMIFSLHRPDVLPVGDLSIRKGVKVLYSLKEVPSPAKIEELCKCWRPYSSVASWYMYRLIEDKVTPTNVSVVLPVTNGLPGGEGGAAARSPNPSWKQPQLN